MALTETPMTTRVSETALSGTSMTIRVSESALTGTPMATRVSETALTEPTLQSGGVEAQWVVKIQVYACYWPFFQIEGVEEHIAAFTTLQIQDLTQHHALV